MTKKILVVMSSESALPLQENKTHSSGFYLNEFGVPARRLIQEGYELTIATPLGNRPALDKDSDVVKFFKDEAEHQQIKTFVDQTLSGSIVKLSDAAEHLDEYAAVFLPGGHAPMIELMRDPDLRRVLVHFHAHALPTALICHAPVALLAAQDGAAAYQDTLQSGGTPTAQAFLYAGYQATVFSTPEEKETEEGFDAPMLYYPADALNAAGMTVQNSAKWSSHVIRDRELITGQNPMSDEEFVTVLLSALKENPAAASA